MLITTTKARVILGSVEKFVESGKAYSSAAKAAGAVEHYILPTYEENEFFEYELWESMEARAAFISMQDPFFSKESITKSTTIYIV